MKCFFVFLLLGCFLLNSCHKEEDDSVEEIGITKVFYEDFFDKDDINIVSDSLYFINSEEQLKRITNDIPSVYTKIGETDFSKNTIIITAALQDYNIFKYEVKLFINDLSKTCNLIFDYVLDDPSYLEKTYFRVWVCIVPKMSYEPHKSYVHNNISVNPNPYKDKRN